MTTHRSLQDRRQDERDMGQGRIPGHAQNDVRPYVRRANGRNGEESFRGHLADLDAPYSRTGEPKELDFSDV